MSRYRVELPLVAGSTTDYSWIVSAERGLISIFPVFDGPKHLLVALVRAGYIQVPGDRSEI